MAHLGEVILQGHCRCQDVVVSSPDVGCDRRRVKAYQMVKLDELFSRRLVKNIGWHWYQEFHEDPLNNCFWPRQVNAHSGGGYNGRFVL